MDVSVNGRAFQQRLCDAFLRWAVGESSTMFGAQSSSMTRGKIKTLAWAVSIHSDMSRRWVCLPSRLESNAKPSGLLLSAMLEERRQHGRVRVGLAVGRLPPSPGRLRRWISIRVGHARVYVVDGRTVGDGGQSPQSGISRVVALDAGTLADGGQIARIACGRGHVFHLSSPLT